MCGTAEPRLRLGQWHLKQRGAIDAAAERQISVSCGDYVSDPVTVDVFDDVVMESVVDLAAAGLPVQRTAYA
jgi:hypothetical protein